MDRLRFVSSAGSTPRIHARARTPCVRTRAAQHTPARTLRTRNTHTCGAVLAHSLCHAAWTRPCFLPLSRTCEDASDRERGRAAPDIAGGRARIDQCMVAGNAAAAEGHLRVLGYLAGCKVSLPWKPVRPPLLSPFFHTSLSTRTPSRDAGPSRLRASCTCAADLRVY